MQPPVTIPRFCRLSLGFLLVLWCRKVFDRFLCVFVCVAVCICCGGMALKLCRRARGGIGRRGSTGEACGLGLSTQWGTIAEALPSAHAGVAAGSPSLHAPPSLVFVVRLSATGLARPPVRVCRMAPGTCMCLCLNSVPQVRPRLTRRVVLRLKRVCCRVLLWRARTSLQP